MTIYKLAVIIRNSSREGDFLVVKETPPPKLPEEEYQNYIDSELWDLPSATLSPLSEASRSAIVIDGADSCAEKINLQLLDVDSALQQVLSQVGSAKLVVKHWEFWKYVEEPNFGPEPFVHTLFILGRLKLEEESLQESTKWMSVESSLKLLVEVTPGNSRMGPLAVVGLLIDSVQPRKWKVPPPLRYQEYPPGVVIVPMGSRTKEPFSTTNLVLVAPDDAGNACGDSGFAAYGDALLMDPGCLFKCHGELMEIVAELPRNLVVFVTHHHYDHTDGLSVVQKCNPTANLLAHENTLHRIGKDHWSLGRTAVSGGEKICIGGQRLDVIFAPGHTDGHMALRHVSTNSLVVGDHCVGQGSAILDITSGGNMTDYFRTTYNFLELSPHALIPMHGRVNLWPKQMLCGYLKHRRERELSILKAIESGAETLLDIIAKAYADLPTRLWLPASSNVRLHVDHLAQQNKLPKAFSIKKYKASCGLCFLWGWMWVYLKRGVHFKVPKLAAATLAVAVFGIFYAVKGKLNT